MPDIVRAIPDVQLVIGGTGPLKEPLLQLSQTLGMENHIRFAGFIPEEDLPTFFGAADAFILPTIALEGFASSRLKPWPPGHPHWEHRSAAPLKSCAISALIFCFAIRPQAPCRH